MAVTDELLMTLAKISIDGEMNHHSIDQFCQQYPDITVEEGYRGQRMRAACMEAEGHRVVGYKLGGTSLAKINQLKSNIYASSGAVSQTTQVIYGRLMEYMQLEAEEDLILNRCLHPKVEPEFAFIMGQDIAGPFVSAVDIIWATEAVAPAFEVIDSRFHHFKIGRRPDALIDNTSASFFKLGHGRVDPKRFDLNMAGMKLKVNDEYTGFGAGASEKAIAFYTERARHGVGLIIAGMCYAENTVEWHGAGTMPCPTANPAIFKRMAVQMTEKIHAYGAKVFIQLSAGFGRVSNRFRPGDLPIAPSPIPYRWNPQIICRAISTEEVEAIVRAMGQAAAIAKEAGFDGVEIHAMHEGYLIDQFAMACSNKRTDKYGGSLENRIRFAVEIVQEIKKRCGADYPVVMRYSSKSFMKDFGSGALPGETFKEMGRDMEEGMVIAGMLEEAGYDALDADVGCYDSWYWNHPPMYFEKGMYLPFNRELKKHVSIPIITAGRMDDPELAVKAVEEEATDMIAMARPLLADGEIVEKIRAGQLEDIRPCISCQEGCIGRLKKYLHISCAVNPAACREREFALTPAKKVRKIAVVGGGVAGCEAARVLKLRGHDVTILEKSQRLGGKLHAAGAPYFKEDDRALIAWYCRQIEKLDIPVRYGVSVTDAQQLRDYEAVIVASGSEAVCLELGDAVTMARAEDVLEHPEQYAGPFAIIGGGLVGCEMALMLAQMGQTVSIVEAMPELMYANGPICYANRQMLIDLIAFHQIPVYADSLAQKTVPEGLIIERTAEKEENSQNGTGNGGTPLIPAKTIVYAVGYRADDSLYRQLWNGGREVYKVGDVKEGAGNILRAIWDAYEIAANL